VVDKHACDGNKNFAGNCDEMVRRLQNMKLEVKFTLWTQNEMERTGCRQFLHEIFQNIDVVVFICPPTDQSVDNSR